MLAERLDDDPVEVPLAALDLDRILLVEVELLALVIERRGERDFPGFGDAIGAGAAAELLLAVRLLAIEGGRAANGEHPVVPAIAGGRRGRLISAETHRDTELCRNGVARDEPKQADAQRVGELSAHDVLRVRRSRDRAKGFRDLLKPALPLEAERVLEPAGPGLGAGDQHMDFGFRAVANVVHERGFGPEEVIEAVLAAIEEHLDPGHRHGLLLGVSGQRVDGESEQEDREHK